MSENKTGEPLTLRDYLNKYSSLKRAKSLTDLQIKQNPPSMEDQFKSLVRDFLRLIRDKLRDQKIQKVFTNKINEIQSFFDQSLKKLKNSQSDEQGTNIKSTEESILNFQTQKELPNLPEINRQFELQSSLGGSSQILNLNSQNILNLSPQKIKSTKNIEVRNEDKVKLSNTPGGNSTTLSKYKSFSGLSMKIEPIQEKDNEGELPRESEILKSKKMKKIPRISKKTSGFDFQEREQ